MNEYIESSNDFRMNYKFVAMNMNIVVVKFLISSFDKNYIGRRQTIDCVSLFFAPENFLDKKLPKNILSLPF